MTSEPESVLSNIEIFSVTVGKHLKKKLICYTLRKALNLHFLWLYKISDIFGGLESPEN